METRQIASGISVAAQLSPDDIAEAVAMGFRTIVNNRPDHEEPGQPLAADLAAIAGEHGVDYVHFPVVSGAITPEDIAGFAAMKDGLEGPLLLFCRSGARSAMLWQLASQS